MVSPQRLHSSELQRLHAARVLASLASGELPCEPVPCLALPCCRTHLTPAWERRPRAPRVAYSLISLFRCLRPFGPSVRQVYRLVRKFVTIKLSHLPSLPLSPQTAMHHLKVAVKKPTFYRSYGSEDYLCFSEKPS